jgi:two-component system chemotaxis response regulator CheY
MARILTIDDSATVRKLVRIALSGLGHSMEEACNGAEGLKLLGLRKFDVVILDLMMPVMDGIVTLRMKDAMKNTTPVLLLTAEINDTLATAMASPSVMEYLKKPLEASKLRVAVGQVLTLAADNDPPA